MAVHEDSSDYDQVFLYSNSTASPEESNATMVVSVIVYAVTCLVGIPGNAFVLWIAGLKMKRTVNVVWFINLALADLLCCLAVPFSIADAVMVSHWPYGNALCKIIPSIVLLNMFASVFTLTVISLDRLVLVVRPVWAQNNRSLSLAWLLCGVSWLLALSLSLPSVVQRGTVLDVFSNTTFCTFVSEEDFYSLEREVGSSWAVRVSHVFRLVFGFLLPILVISICYSLIVLRIRKSNFQSGRVFHIIVAVIVAFFACWLPYHIVGVAREYSEADMFDFDHLSVALAHFNSCLNPVLYVFMGQDFKEKVKLSLRQIFENAFSENVTRSTITTRGQTSCPTNPSEAQL
uniref:G-protein coupled receptors family 1 profile domain-containing protein n=2 Tax=Denticeps clupeoides TaxID=299321 RepID=A0AAY4B8V2_9TELE